MSGTIAIDVLVSSECSVEITSISSYDVWLTRTIREVRPWREECTRICCSGYISNAKFEGQKYIPLSECSIAPAVIKENESGGTQSP